MKLIIFTFSVFFFSIFLANSQQKPENKKMNTALILIDIQNDYFVNGSMTLVGTEKAGSNAHQILEKFRADGLPVIHIQHIATSSTAPFFLPQTTGAEIYEKVKPAKGERVINKHFPNSYRETELLAVLKSKSITNLVICGMMTHMCVDATIRAAKDFGFNSIVIGDACATKNLEVNGEVVKAAEVQKSFLAVFNGFYATVKTTSQYIEVK